MFLTRLVRIFSKTVLLFIIVIVGGCRDLTNRLDEYLTNARAYWKFEGSVLVAWHGKVILSSGYGMASRAVGEPNTPQTRFFIGSITKQFTAAAIMKLHEAGRLDLDAPITRYLPEYPEKSGSKITIHQLLTHTSGIPNLTDNPEIILRRTLPFPDTDLMKVFWDKPLLFEPGRFFHYSNSGYIVLGAIIERISGQSYEAFLHHELLKPAGMLNSGYGRREARLPDRAEGYTLAESGTLLDAVPIHFSVLHSAGAMYSTVEDMLLWDRALARDEILSRKSIALMMSPSAGNHGYGWVMDMEFGREHYFHGGFIDGYNTTFDRWPNEGLCVIVFSNDDEAPVQKIARDLAAIVFGADYTMPARAVPFQVATDQLRRYEGVFRNADGLDRYVYLDEETLKSFSLQEIPKLMMSLAPDTFILALNNSIIYTFGRDADDNISSLNISDNNSSDRFTKIDDLSEMDNRQPIMVSPEILERYVGEYQLFPSKGIPVEGFILIVRRRGKSLTAAVPHTRPIHLQPSSDSSFYHSTAPFELDFIPGRDSADYECRILMSGTEIQGKRLNPKE